MLIDRKPSKIFLLLAQWGKWALGLGLLSALIGQCTSNAMLTRKVQELSDRDVIVELGAGREVMVGRKITPDHNREQFLIEMFKSISWTKNTSPEYQERCKDIAKESKNAKLFKQCQTGIDVGANTQWGKVSSQIYAYQHLIAPEAINAIMPFLIALKPKGYDQPASRDSRTFQVTKFGKAEPFNDGKNGPETKTPVELEVTESKGGPVTRKYTRYYWAYTRPVLRLSKNGAKTPYNEAVEFTQRRGLYLTRILPYEQ